MDQNEQTHFQNYENAIKKFRLGAFGLLFVRFFFTYLVILGFIWGTVVLILRFTTDIEPIVLLWPFAGLLTLISIAFLQAYRRIPTQSALKAFFDKQFRLSGDKACMVPISFDAHL